MEDPSHMAPRWGESRRDSRRRGNWVAAVAAAATCGCLLAGACSSTKTGATGAGGATTVAPARTLHILAGENFWGSIVSQLAGKAGQVTSIVTDPNTDPHNYESSAANARAFAEADYVVVNGAGYDAWATKLLAGNPNPKRKVLTVAELLGKKEGDNPHFWYNPDYVSKVADQVTADLKAADPADAAYFDAQRAALEVAFGPYHARLAAIKARFGGTPIASTESIFVYLANYLDLAVLSPPEFMNAVAEGNDPPAPSVAAFQDLLSQKAVKVLVYNRQTSTAVTTNLKTLATDHQIPVVAVTETIQPPDAAFQDWFDAQLVDLQNSLNRSSGTTASGG